MWRFYASKIDCLKNLLKMNLRFYIQNDQVDAPLPHIGISANLKDSLTV